MGRDAAACSPLCVSKTKISPRHGEFSTSNAKHTFPSTQTVRGFQLLTLSLQDVDLSNKAETASIDSK